MNRITERYQRFRPTLSTCFAIIPAVIAFLLIVPESQAQCTGFNCGPDTESIKFEWSDNTTNVQTGDCYGGFAVEISDPSYPTVGDYLADSKGDIACFFPDAAGDISSSQYAGYNLPVIVTSVVWDEDALEEGKKEIKGATFVSADGLIEDAWYKAGTTCTDAGGNANGSVISSRKGISHIQMCYRPPVECPDPDWDFTEEVISSSAPGKVKLTITETTRGITGVNFVDEFGDPYLINFIVSSSDLTSSDGIHWAPPAGPLPTTVVLYLDQADVNVKEAAYFAEVTSECGVLHIDPVLSFDESPEQFRLEGNYPNPFNPTTNIRFQLSEPSNVTVTVYDVTGREVKNLIMGRELGVGSHSAEWDGTDLHGRAVVSGVYLYRVDAGQNSASGKMVLMK